ncbi:hypothetical protein ABT403_13715 [Streptomyces sp. NPDC000075]
MRGEPIPAEAPRPDGHSAGRGRRGLTGRLVVALPEVLWTPP